MSYVKKKNVSERPNVGGASVRSRNGTRNGDRNGARKGAPSRKGSGSMAK